MCFACEVAHRPQFFFIARSFRIIGLGKNSRQIFGFKELICKIFRNKDLGAKFQSFQVSRTPISPNKKGCGVSAPFLFYNSIISISPACRDKLCVFISPTDSLGYAENCRNGGLTKFRRRREAPRRVYACRGGFECNRLWLLKNSFPQNSQK